MPSVSIGLVRHGQSKAGKGMVPSLEFNRLLQSSPQRKGTHQNSTPELNSASLENLSEVSIFPEQAVCIRTLVPERTDKKE